MMEFNPLLDEQDRLAALQALNILDTPPEERFDRLTRLDSSDFKNPRVLAFHCKDRTPFAIFSDYLIVAFIDIYSESI